MIDTMHDYKGLGLAAPQIHESLRIVVLELAASNPRYPVSQSQGLTTLINPSLEVLDSNLEGYWEGCLSVPGLRGYVERPRQVRVTYTDGEGNQAQLEAQGLLATVIQHELDHLDGVLYVDRLADPHRFAFVEEFERWHQPSSTTSANP